MVIVPLHNTDRSTDFIWSLLSTIPDPEVPVISIAELGVLRKIEFIDEVLTVTITPTYSGCPAMFAIEDDIKNLLEENNFTNYKIKTVHFPIWTTDWLSNEAKQKLIAYGIAPPQHSTVAKNQRPDEVKLNCPFCSSAETKLTSWFGSTACKALYYCKHCEQPFEHFKCHH